MDGDCDDLRQGSQCGVRRLPPIRRSGHTNDKHSAVLSAHRGGRRPGPDMDLYAHADPLIGEGKSAGQRK